MVQQVLKELKELKVLLVIKELKELKEILVQQDNLVLQVQQVHHQPVVMVLMEIILTIVMQVVTQVSVVVVGTLQFILLLPTLETFVQTF